ncbi:MAG: MgtC/SapB family protein [Erysipelotrichia bacterium]|jgi:putative Mg2+ transporter-C (MgtC) family protein|nr:MgtC/SapB family protein [Erysipelotrichia bacterium]
METIIQSIIEYQFVVPRLLTALFLSSMIGVERSRKNRAAGLRTHALVGVASALVMVTSTYLFNEYNALGAFPDPARLGAQIISGIGFLGAGTIIQSRGNVRGLTTAASLWSVGTIGIAAGSGFYFGAILTTILIYVVLRFAVTLENDWINKKQLTKLIVYTTSQDFSVYANLAHRRNIRILEQLFLGSNHVDDHNEYMIMLSINHDQRRNMQVQEYLKDIGSLTSTTQTKLIDHQDDQGDHV